MAGIGSNKSGQSLKRGVLPPGTKELIRLISVFGGFETGMISIQEANLVIREHPEHTFRVIRNESEQL
jgi:hypothetical protein